MKDLKGFLLQSLERRNDQITAYLTRQQSRYVLCSCPLTIQRSSTAVPPRNRANRSKTTEPKNSTNMLICLYACSTRTPAHMHKTRTRKRPNHHIKLHNHPHPKIQIKKTKQPHKNGKSSPRHPEGSGIRNPPASVQRPQGGLNSRREFTSEEYIIHLPRGDDC